MTLEKLKDLCSWHLASYIGLDDIDLETTIYSMYLDSLDIIEMVIKIEDEFDIAIDDEDLPKIETVGDLVKFIEEKTCNLSEDSL